MLLGVSHRESRDSRTEKVFLLFFRLFLKLIPDFVAGDRSKNLHGASCTTPGHTPPLHPPPLPTPLTSSTTTTAPPPPSAPPSSPIHPPLCNPISLPAEQSLCVPVTHSALLMLGESGNPSRAAAYKARHVTCLSSVLSIPCTLHNAEPSRCSSRQLWRCPGG